MRDASLAASGSSRNPNSVNAGRSQSTMLYSSAISRRVTGSNSKCLRCSIAELRIFGKFHDSATSSTSSSCSLLYVLRSMQLLISSILLHIASKAKVLLTYGSKRDKISLNVFFLILLMTPGENHDCWATPGLAERCWGGGAGYGLLL